METSLLLLIYTFDWHSWLSAADTEGAPPKLWRRGEFLRTADKYSLILRTPQSPDRWHFLSCVHKITTCWRQIKILPHGVLYTFSSKCWKSLKVTIPTDKHKLNWASLLELGGYTVTVHGFCQAFLSSWSPTQFQHFVPLSCGPHSSLLTLFLHYFLHYPGV